MDKKQNAGKMISFSFFKEAMETRTNKAQLILLGDRRNPIKVWLPLSQIEVKDDPERPGYNVVTLPLWLYAKTDLPDFTECFVPEN